MRKIGISLLTVSMLLAGCSSKDTMDQSKIKDSFTEVFNGINEVDYYEAVSKTYSEEEGDPTSITYTKSHEEGQVAYSVYYSLDSTEIVSGSISIVNDAHMDEYMCLNGVDLTYSLMYSYDDYDSDVIAPTDLMIYEYVEDKASYDSGTYTLYFTGESTYMKVVAVKGKGNYFSQFTTSIYSDEEYSELTNYTVTKYLVKDADTSFEEDQEAANEALASDLNTLEEIVEEGMKALD